MSWKMDVMSPDSFLLIKKKGIFDLNKLFADIYRWMVDHKYEFHEEDHKTRVPTPLGQEVEIKTHGWRNEDDFTRWWQYVTIYYWDAIEVEAMVNGHKKIMTKCRIKILMRPQFEFDFQNKWEANKMFRGMRKFWVQNLMKKKIDIEGDKLEYESFDLHELIKHDLDMLQAGNQFAHFWK